MKKFTFAIVLICGISYAAFAQGEAALPDYSDVLKRIPPRSPGDELETLRVHPDFEMQLIAAEPLVMDPMAMAVDEFGRMFVVEMRGYAENAEGHLGRVKLLRDTDGDGDMDQATVFVEGLSWPSAVFPWDGGVVIADAPDLLFAKDTDDDDKADMVETLFTGFYNDNPARVPNSLAWELGNRIHGTSGTISANLKGLVRKPEQAESEAVNFGGYDFAIDPRAMSIERRSGGAQHGMTLDPWGRKFVCSNSDHVQQALYEDRYLRRNPLLIAPPARVSIAAEGPQAQVFRLSPVEAWRQIRTRLRVEGKITGPVEGGGRAAGYFTSATGITIYKGDAWPQQYRGQVFVSDVGSNLVHRKTLEFDGIQATARRADVAKEFIASSDNWFRPVQFYNAPDGTLWVVDMYREIIENIHTIAPEIKQHLDSSSGNDRGRIWRIAPKGYEARAIPRLADYPTGRLVATLGHANAWHRETAARLIYQRQDKATVGPLVEMATGSGSALARLHAMYALDGLGALTAEAVEARLGDQAAGVQAHAIRLVERLGVSDDEKRDLLMRHRDSLAAHAEAYVSYQWAFTLGELAERDPLTIAESLLAHPDSSWVRLAVLSSMRRGDMAVVLPWLADVFRARHPEASPDVFREAADLAAAFGETRSIAEALSLMDDAQARDTVAMLRGLRIGVKGRKDSVRDLIAAEGFNVSTERVDRLLDAAAQTAADTEQPLEGRVAALESLELTGFETARPALEAGLRPTNPREVQEAAARVADRFKDEGVGAMLLDAWPTLSPVVRPITLGALLGRTEWANALLDRIEAGTFPASDLRPQDMDVLISGSQTRERAKKLLILDREARPRYQVVEAYAAATAKLTGDAGRGRTVFVATCAGCHELEGMGNAIAPNLAAFAARGPEAILINALDPNREIDPAYTSYVVQTTGGRTLVGMITAETAASMVVTGADGQVVSVPRSEIASQVSTGVSFMPEGLEAAIGHQGMADLIAYLMSFVER